MSRNLPQLKLLDFQSLEEVLSGKFLFADMYAEAPYNLQGFNQLLLITDSPVKPVELLDEIAERACLQNPHLSPITFGYITKGIYYVSYKLGDDSHFLIAEVVGVTRNPEKLADGLEFSSFTINYTRKISNTIDNIVSVTAEQKEIAISPEKVNTALLLFSSRFVTNFLQGLTIQQPENTAILQGLGYAYLTNFNYQEAELHLRKLVTKNPGNYAAKSYLATVFRMTSRDEEAIKLLEEAKESASKKGDKMFVATCWNDMGQIVANTSPDKAIALYHEALKHSPTYGGIYINLAWTLRNTGKTNEALTCLKGGIRKVPKNDCFQGPLHHNYGFTLVLAGERDKGLTYLKKAIELDRNSPATYALIGDIYRSQGNSDQAEEHYKVALDLLNRSVPSLRVKATERDYITAARAISGLHMMGKSVPRTPDLDSQQLDETKSRMEKDPFRNALKL